MRSASALVAALAALGGLLSWPGAAHGQTWVEMTSARQASDEEELEMQIEFGAGRLRVGAAPEDLLYRARIRYDAGAFRPLREFERAGREASVRLGLRGGEDLRDLDLDFDWSFPDPSSIRLRQSGGAGGDDAGEMEVGLSPRVPTDLRVRVGAAESTMELGGVPLRRLRLSTGASDTRVSFDRANPVPMEELHVEAGAASLEIRGLGNARARRVEVENAVGEVTLDLSGRWTADATASVKTGVGKVTLRVPPDVGLELDRRTFLSSFSGLGLEETDGGRYRSENWEEADRRLRVRVEATFGSIEVERAP